MATITIPGMFLTGDHASRPAAGDVGSGSLYACSTHGLIYQSDGSSWTTWATMGETGAAAHIADATDAHDASAISLADAGGNTAETELEGAIDEIYGLIDGLTGGGGVTEEFAVVPHSGGTQVSTSVVGAANRAVIVPVTILATTEITSLRIRVASGSTGTVSVGIYDSSLARVATSGSVACPANVLATIALTANYTASPGRYYFGLSASSNTPQFSVTGAAATAGPMHSFFMDTAHPLPNPFVSAGASPVVPAIVGIVTGGWTP